MEPTFLERLIIAFDKPEVVAAIQKIINGEPETAEQFLERRLSEIKLSIKEFECKIPLCESALERIQNQYFISQKKQLLPDLEKALALLKTT